MRNGFVGSSCEVLAVWHLEEIDDGTDLCLVVGDAVLSVSDEPLSAAGIKNGTELEGGCDALSFFLGG